MFFSFAGDLFNVMIQGSTVASTKRHLRAQHVDEDVNHVTRDGGGRKRGQIAEIVFVTVTVTFRGTFLTLFRQKKLKTPDIDGTLCAIRNLFRNVTELQ
jgi:hypothetical protein